MSKISSEFIVGSAIGYFFANNILIFTFGVATGVVIQEKFGSVYKFSQFCYDSSVELYKQQLSKLKSKFNKNTDKNNIIAEPVKNIEEFANNLNNKDD
jgi:hypothetical protein